MLSARDVHKSFDSNHVLRGIDLDIAPGTITCAIGPSGTGKTTLLRALAMLDYPDKGSITIDETDYQFPDEPQRQNCCAVAPSYGCFSIAFSVAAFDLAGKHSSSCPQA
jgi:cystine transport system ATP-binding protein